MCRADNMLEFGSELAVRTRADVEQLKSYEDRNMSVNSKSITISWKSSNITQGRSIWAVDFGGS